MLPCRRRLAALATAAAAVGPQAAAGFDAEHRIQSARLYGNVGQLQYYYVDLLIGSPKPQRASVIADTGSTVCAFPCSGCEHCGSHLDPAYDMSLSETSKWIMCGTDEECDRCDHGRCSYLQSYTEGSSISGSWFHDYISLGDEIQRNPPVLGRLGCHLHETRLFYTQRANGIFGMAPGHSGRPTILEDLFRDTEHINTAIFAMCLAEQGGLLSVGGYNGTLHVKNSSGAIEEPTWVHMAVRSYYEVEIAQISVDGGGLVRDAGGFGHTIVDSGTTFTYLPQGLYQQLRGAVAAYCATHNECGAAAKFSKCWRVRDKAAGLARFPVLKVSFAGGQVVPWRPEAYMYLQTGSSDTYCYGFDDNGGVHETVLGATFLLHKDVIFDLANKRLGIADAHCPSFSKRPPPPSGSLLVRAAKKVRASMEYSLESFTSTSWLPFKVEAVAAVAVLLSMAFGGFVVVVRNLRAVASRSRTIMPTTAAPSGSGGGGGLPLAPTWASLAPQPRSRRVPQEDVPVRRSSTSSAAVPARAASSAAAASEVDLEDVEGSVEAQEGRGLVGVPLDTWLRPQAGSGSGEGERTPGSGSGGNSSDGGAAAREGMLLAS